MLHLIHFGYNILNQTGYLIKNPTPQILADYIEKIILDNNLRDNLGRKGRKFVINNFDWNSSVKQMIEAYKLV